MRLTRPLFAGWRDLTIRRWNKQWKEFAKIYDIPLKIPPALAGKRVKIVEASSLLQPEEVVWEPPVPDDPRWVKEVPLEEQEDWKTEPAYTFKQGMLLYEGMTQACLIAKAQHFNELPTAVQQRVGAVNTPDRDMLLQRYIMQSQAWHTDEERLPKPPPPEEKTMYKWLPQWGITFSKSRQILLRNLLRLCQYHVANVPSLGSRRHIYNPLLHSFVMYKDKPIVQRQELDCIVSSGTALPPFANRSEVEASIGHQLPDMWPVYPTVDFKQSNNYELRNDAFVSSDVSDLHPHTLVELNHRVDHAWPAWTDSQWQASQTLTCLMYSAALARERYGPSIKLLPEPISLQHVLLDHDGYYVTCFQLNTLDLSEPDGVKNMVWTSERQQLFDKIWAKPWLEEPEWKKTRLENFDGDAIETLIAAYLTGCPDVNLRICDSIEETSL